MSTTSYHDAAIQAPHRVHLQAASSVTDAQLSTTIDHILIALDTDMHPLRRAWLRLRKRYYERAIPTFHDGGGAR